MKPNDETIYSEKEATAAAEEVMNTEEQAQEQPQPKGKKMPWKAVTIGGVTGILLGAAGMLVGRGQAAAQQDSDDAANEGEQQDTTPQEAEATNTGTAQVSDDMSFAEAFAEARQQLGPGGVFEWRGGVYGTYYATEWNAMSSAEQEQFTAQAMGGRTPVTPGNHDVDHPDDTTDMTNRFEGRDDDDSRDTLVQGGPEDRRNDLTNRDERNDHDDSRNTLAQGGPGEGEAHSDEPEVHLLGVEQHQTEDGRVINVGRMTIGGENVALVDIGNDHVFDAAVSDPNHNDILEENEIVDISDRGITVEEFAMASAMESGAPNTGMSDTASQQQDDLAPDTPDYMNDADVQSI
jgi:hypothetical protein